MTPGPTGSTDPTAEDQRHSADDDSLLPSFIALGLALLLVLLGVWLFTAKQKNQELQNCFAEHRQDCVPLDTSR